MASREKGRPGQDAPHISGLIDAQVRSANGLSFPSQAWSSSLRLPTYHHPTQFSDSVRMPCPPSEFLRPTHAGSPFPSRCSLYLGLLLSCHVPRGGGSGEHGLGQCFAPCDAQQMFPDSESSHVSAGEVVSASAASSLLSAVGCAPGPGRHPQEPLPEPGLQGAEPGTQGSGRCTELHQQLMAFSVGGGGEVEGGRPLQLSQPAATPGRGAWARGRGRCPSARPGSPGTAALLPAREVEAAGLCSPGREAPRQVVQGPAAGHRPRG